MKKIFCDICRRETDECEYIEKDLDDRFFYSGYYKNKTIGFIFNGFEDCEDYGEHKIPHWDFEIICKDCLLDILKNLEKAEIIKD